ncbi:MAG: glutathione S-transferase N-terminal domain-containing protein [Candidatus Aenigmarchaeota archaeon]|nr:glutathione S-transferase N-terminal domain-containing protein [Candidatus Aenigmarchaeota archaeon]
MKVKIYTTPACHFCNMAKKYFETKNITYEEIDVSKDLNAAREMIEKTGQMGVPVIEIDDRIIIGFNRNALDRILQGLF